MVWKFSFVLYVAAIAGQVAIAQNSAGNILSGDAKADVLRRYDGPEALPKPNKILIQDFAVSSKEITIDESIAARLHRKRMLRQGVDEDSSPQILAQQVQTAFAKTLAGELKKIDIQTINVPSQKISSDEGGVDSSDLVIAGEFIAINEGDEAKRIMVGFGRGASDIKTHVVVSSVVKGHQTVVLEFNLSSESGKKPGAIATMGVGSLAVGAAAGGVGDKKSTVEADASRMAKLVARQLKAFMVDQKWISNTSSEATIGY